MPKVAAILFDAVGTLLRPDPPPPQVYAAVARRFGSELTEAEVAVRIRAAAGRHFGGRSESSESIEHAAWRRVVSEVFAELPDAGGALFRELWAHFSRAEHYRVYDDVTPAWRLATESRITVAVASNFDRRLIGICRELPPLDGCPHVFTSSGLGHAKPDRRFFLSIAEQLQLPPERIAMIGDDPVLDVAGAHSAGMPAVLVDRSAQEPADAAGDLVAAVRRVLPTANR